MRRIALVAAILLLPASQVKARPCNDRMSRSAPQSRFRDLGGGTVADVSTGLTWQRCPLGATFSDGGTSLLPFDDRCPVTATFLWQEALQAAAALNAAGGQGGFTDWRLPNQKELESLIETACYGPAINDWVFPDTPSGWFYSSTPYFQGTVTSTSVHGCTFSGTGTCGLVGKSTTRRYVRLVRG